MTTRKDEKEKDTIPQVKVEDLEPSSGKHSGEIDDETSSPRGGVEVRRYDIVGAFPKK